VDLNITPYESDPKKLYNFRTNSEVDFNDELYHYAEIPASILTNPFQFTGRTWGDNVGFAAVGFLDSDRNIIWEIDSDINTNFTNEEVTLLSNAEYVIIQSTNTGKLGVRVQQIQPTIAINNLINEKINSLKLNKYNIRGFSDILNGDPYSITVDLIKDKGIGYINTLYTEGNTIFDNLIQQNNANWYYDTQIHAADEYTYYVLQDFDSTIQTSTNYYTFFLDGNFKIIKNQLDNERITSRAIPCYINRTIRPQPSPKGTKYVVILLPKPDIDALLENNVNKINFIGYKMKSSLISLDKSNNEYLTSRGQIVQLAESDSIYFSTVQNTSDFAVAVAAIPEGAKYVISHKADKMHNVYFFTNNAYLTNIQPTPQLLFNSGHNAPAMYEIPEGAYCVAVNIDKNLFIRDKDITFDRANFTIGPLANKRICIIGDSLIFINGYALAIDGVTRANLGFQYELFNTGAIIESYGYSGRPYAAYTSDYVSDNIVTSFKAQCTNIADQDIFILFGGANDVRISTPLGAEPTIYTSPNLDESTFHGAIGSLIKYIRENNSTAQIYLCTLTPSKDGSRLWAKNKTYRDAIIYEGEFWHCPIIDLWTEVNFTPNYNESEYLYDSIHPRYSGCRKIGKIITSRLINDIRSDMLTI